jgi:glutamate synthase (NADPH/NADH) large chain
LFLLGVVGVGFLVRNSGGVAVVVGVGDHACVYMSGGRAVVLGEIGRNFAAGMSGGVAYVRDPNGDLELRLNREMVALEPLTEDDLDLVFELVERHVAATESTLGRRMLARWEAEAAHFVKVMPVDYRRVLEAIAEAEANGADVDEAVMVAARSTSGKG